MTRLPPSPSTPIEPYIVAGRLLRICRNGTIAGVQSNRPRSAQLLLLLPTLPGRFGLKSVKLAVSSHPMKLDQISHTHGGILGLWNQLTGQRSSVT